jgi:hypothetical protein
MCGLHTMRIKAHHAPYIYIYIYIYIYMASVECKRKMRVKITSHLLYSTKLYKFFYDRDNWSNQFKKRNDMVHVN